MGARKFPIESMAHDYDDDDDIDDDTDDQHDDDDDTQSARDTFAKFAGWPTDNSKPNV